MATPAQFRRLQQIERHLHAEPALLRPDLSVLTVDELRTLQRYVGGTPTDADQQAVFHTIGPKLKVHQ